MYLVVLYDMKSWKGVYSRYSPDMKPFLICHEEYGSQFLTQIDFVIFEWMLSWPEPFASMWKQDLEVSVEEFKSAVGQVCLGKTYADFPLGFKRFIDSSYLTVDVDGKFPNAFANIV